MGIALNKRRREVAVAIAVAGLGAAAWLLLGGVGGGGTAQASHGKYLDHFLCGRGSFSGPATTPNITLRDQFAPQAVAHKVGKPEWACNPADKHHPGVGTFNRIHPNNHLVAYRLSGKVPLKRLRVTNQFQTPPATGHNLVTDPGTTQQPKRPLILVPTQKLQPQHPPPANIDHFKCYPTKPRAINKQVTVTDQFVNNLQIVVRKPALICNPAVKKHGTQTFPIQHRGQHLVCYTIDPIFGGPINVQFTNQFGPRGLSVNQIFQLCVPSQKKIVP